MYEIITKTTFQDHEQAEALERNYLPAHAIASAQTSWAWDQRNPEGLFLLRQKGRSELLGHLSAFPVRKDISKAMRTGELYDTELPSSAVLPYGARASADLYFAIICVHERHRPLGTRALLLFFAQFLKEKMKTGQCEMIEDIFAEAGSKEGQRLLKRRGFQKCKSGQPLPCYYKAKLADVVKARII